MRFLASLGSVCALSACGFFPQDPPDSGNSFDPQGVEARLSGKKLIARDGTSYGLNEDGSFIGPNQRGRWSVQNGEFCRTLPGELGEVTSCDTAKFEGDEVQFLGPDGSISTFEIAQAD